MEKCKKCNREFNNIHDLKNHLKRKITCDTIFLCSNPTCSKVIKTGNKFCSQKCAGLVNSPGRKHEDKTRIKISISNGGTGKVFSKLCLHCGKAVSSQYCNQTCYSKYIELKKIQDWIEGKINGNSPSGYANYVKKYLMKKYNNKCSKCGWGEINLFSKNIPLDIHHKDGNRYHNFPDNVDLLCPNCHSLTETYKGANKKYNN